LVILSVKPPTPTFNVGGGSKTRNLIPIFDLLILHSIEALYNQGGGCTLLFDFDMERAFTFIEQDYALCVLSGN